MRTRRLLALVATSVAAIVPLSHPAEAATSYRVVGTGDSILAMVMDIPAPSGALLNDTAWVNVEYGRAPYVVGMANQASTASIWPLLLARSQPGGWVLLQDNAIGVSPTTWGNLLRRIVDELPDDRCLLIIPPAFHPDFNAQRHAEAQVLAQVTAAEVAAQPCRATIPWPAAILNDRSLVCDPDAVPQIGGMMPADVDNHTPSRCDGQHPSKRGQIWLNRAIEAATGLSLR